MRKLPFRPALYVYAGLGLIVLGFASTIGQSPVLQAVEVLSMVALLALTFLWVWQANRLSRSILTEYDDVIRARRLELFERILLATAMTAVVGLTIAAPLGVNSVPASPLLIVAVMVGALSGFGLFWTAASAMCAAERATGQGSPHVLGTFIQFVYLLFAVGLLYRRLQAVEAASANKSGLISGDDRIP